jgi:hypothetical protein
MGTTMGRICCGSIIWRTRIPNDPHGLDPFESGILPKAKRRERRTMPTQRFGAWIPSLEI